MFGTVQGSVLGPALFSLYVRYQPKVFEQCKFKSTSFADDSNGRKTFAIEFQLNVCKNDVPCLLQEITEWMNWMFMKINPEKTEILPLYPKELEERIIIQGTMVGEQCIRFSKVVKNDCWGLAGRSNEFKHACKQSGIAQSQNIEGYREDT